MEPLLTLADELERRDAAVAVALADVERRQAEVDELRARATAVAALLERLPVVRAEREDAERAAAEELARAEAAQADAEPDDPAPPAAVRAAGAKLERAREASAELDRDAAAHRADAERLAARAAGLAAGVRDVPAPAPGLDGALEWASQARGALLLERSALAREREELVREASELVASVSGEPSTAVSVGDLKRRLRPRL